jgi:hypothetical protein
MSSMYPPVREDNRTMTVVELDAAFARHLEDIKLTDLKPRIISVKEGDVHAVMPTTYAQILMDDIEEHRNA